MSARAPEGSAHVRAPRARSARPTWSAQHACQAARAPELDALTCTPFCAAGANGGLTHSPAAPQYEAAPRPSRPCRPGRTTRAGAAGGELRQGGSGSLEPRVIRRPYAARTGMRPHVRTTRSPPALAVRAARAASLACSHALEPGRAAGAARPVFGSHARRALPGQSLLARAPGILAAPRALLPDSHTPEPGRAAGAAWPV